VTGRAQKRALDSVSAIAQKYAVGSALQQLI
jgi:hypothetical protein